MKEITFARLQLAKSQYNKNEPITQPFSQPVLFIYIYILISANPYISKNEGCNVILHIQIHIHIQYLLVPETVIMHHILYLLYMTALFLICCNADNNIAHLWHAKFVLILIKSCYAQKQQQNQCKRTSKISMKNNNNYQFSTRINRHWIFYHHSLALRLRHWLQVVK